MSDKEKPRVGSAGQVENSVHTEKNTRSRWEVQPGVFAIPADASLEEMIQAGYAVIDALNAQVGGGNG
jgi:hypothetical protein